MSLVSQTSPGTPARMEDVDPRLVGADSVRNPMSWKSVLWIGYGIVFLFFGVFGIWAGFAPLGSGAIAMGKVEVAGNQRTVQHLEGGIIQRLEVEEGQVVKAGDLLLVLDDTRARSQFTRIQKQYLSALAAEARLKAEREGSNTIQFPEELLKRSTDPDVANTLDGQRRLFQNRRRSQDSQVGLLDRRIAKSREEIAALDAQQRADRRQLNLINEEIAGVRELVDKGLERKPRLLSLQRTEAELLGSIDNRTALKARAEQTIAETEFQLLGLLEQTATEVETELRETQIQLEDLRQQMTAARDSLERTHIHAPISGRIYGLRFHTVGGVIGPGEQIMNIVPDNEELVVSVQLQPTDRDVVEVGAVASVRFTAFSQRTTKPIDGEVIRISADAIQPENAQPFYEARIRINQAMLQANELELTPGMPAQAIISTGEQTMLDYLISPITRSLETALREK